MSYAEENYYDEPTLSASVNPILPKSNSSPQDVSSGGNPSKSDKKGKKSFKKSPKKKSVASTVVPVNDLGNEVAIRQGEHEADVIVQHLQPSESFLVRFSKAVTDVKKARCITILVALLTVLGQFLHSSGYTCLQLEGVISSNGFSAFCNFIRLPCGCPELVYCAYFYV